MTVLSALLIGGFFCLIVKVVHDAGVRSTQVIVEEIRGKIARGELTEARMLVNENLKKPYFAENSDFVQVTNELAGKEHTESLNQVARAKKFADFQDQQTLALSLQSFETFADIHDIHVLKMTEKDFYAFEQRSLKYAEEQLNFIESLYKKGVNKKIPNAPPIENLREKFEALKKRVSRLEPATPKKTEEGKSVSVLHIHVLWI